MGLWSFGIAGGDDMQPLIITAHLMTGFASSDPWSPAIDGILAYQFMREKLGAEEFALNQHRNDKLQPVDGLPLAVEQWQSWWWYQCSSPIYRAHADVTRYLHRRFDAGAAERYWGNQGKSGKVLVAGGPYKNVRMPIIQHVTPAVHWSAVGDKAEVERLLSKVTHIGGRCGAGYGRIREWSVTDGGEQVKVLACGHRPLPVDHEKASVLCGPIIPWGVRPPVRHDGNITLCAMPEHRESINE